MTPFLMLSALILAVHLIDVAYTTWAIRRYGLREGNFMWRWLANAPVDFIVDSTLYMLAVLFILGAIGTSAWFIGFGLAGRVVVMIRNVNLVRARR